MDGWFERDYGLLLPFRRRCKPLENGEGRTAIDTSVMDELAEHRALSRGCSGETVFLK